MCPVYFTGLLRALNRLIMGKHFENGKGSGILKFQSLVPLSPSISVKPVPPSSLLPSVFAPQLPCRHTEARSVRTSIPVGLHRLPPAPSLLLFHHQVFLPTTAYFSPLVVNPGCILEFRGHFLNYQCLGPSPKTLTYLVWAISNS